VSNYNPEQRAALLRLLQERKLHVRKHALARVAAHIASQFAHPWAPIGHLIRYFALFPDPLLSFWADHPAGHVVITARESRYEPGSVQEGRRVLDGVAFVSLYSLAGEGEHPLIYVAHLFDHLLGCDGIQEGTWLSEGGGYLPAWKEVGRRLYRQFSLGYAGTEAARADPRRYFAEGLVAYWRDRPGLRVQDPGLEAILRTTLMDAAFWRRTQGGTQVPDNATGIP